MRWSLQVVARAFQGEGIITGQGLGGVHANSQPQSEVMQMGGREEVEGDGCGENGEGEEEGEGREGEVAEVKEMWEVEVKG